MRTSVNKVQTLTTVQSGVALSVTTRLGGGVWSEYKAANSKVGGFSARPLRAPLPRLVSMTGGRKTYRGTSFLITIAVITEVP